MCGHRNTMVFPEFGIKIKTDRQTNQRKLKKKKTTTTKIKCVHFYDKKKNHDDWSK